MCGITGIHFKNPRDLGISRSNLERLVDEMLIGIEPRGDHATGLLTVDARGEADLVKADTCATQFVNWRHPIPKRVRTILGHTRFATQGTPTALENNHPVQHGSVYAIHNGHISNDYELFRDYGMERFAEVDSEAIPALVSLVGLDKAEEALEELEGGFAVALVDPVKFPNMTVLAKGYSSPLEVLETKHAIVWASTTSCLQNACEKVLGFKPSVSKIESLHIGDMLVIEGETVERRTFKPKSRARVTKTYAYTDSWGTSYDSTGYSYNPRTGRQGTAVLDAEDDSVWVPCVSCGCKRLWHGAGGEFAGSCRFVSDKGFSCRCIAFVQPKEDTAQIIGVEFCDGCGREFPVADLASFGKNLLCKSFCAKQMYVMGPTTEELRQKAEEAVGRQVEYADEFGVSELDEGAYEALEDAVHEKSLELASSACGMTPDYIDWLCHRMPDGLIESGLNDYLKAARKTAEDALAEAASALWDEVAEIDQKRWERGDYKVGNACDTESDEECGVVVSIENGQVIA